MSACPPRGLHGEAYRGHIFWDEMYIFPFLTLRVPELTRSLLLLPALVDSMRPAKAPARRVRRRDVSVAERE